MISSIDHFQGRPLIIRIKMDVDIGIHKSVLRILDCPKNVHFWWSEKEKTLAISGVSEPTELSISIPDHFYRHGTGGSKLKNAKIRKALKNLADWKDKSVHVLTGVFIPEFKIVVFKTNEEKTEVQSNV